MTPEDIRQAQMSGPHASDEMVRQKLEEVVYALPGVVQFMQRYASWNGYFGSGVATLAGKVGRCRGLFRDPDEPIKLLADRSVLVASYFFDAARDEFDDRDTEHRDSHRCLAQAVLRGLVHYAEVQGWACPTELLDEDPQWLRALNDRIAIGYGNGAPDDVSVFRAIGYHLGSELLADQEFTIIEEVLTKTQPDLVEFLKGHHYLIEGLPHNCFSWISIHSSYGADSGGVEAEHFEAAMAGVNKALKYSPPNARRGLREQILLGVGDFSRDHYEFFRNVNACRP
jgi:hypothetical protein